MKFIKLFLHQSSWGLPSSEFYDVIVMGWKIFSKAELIFGKQYEQVIYYLMITLVIIEVQL